MSDLLLLVLLYIGVGIGMTPSLVYHNRHLRWRYKILLLLVLPVLWVPFIMYSMAIAPHEYD